MRITRVPLLDAADSAGAKRDFAVWNDFRSQAAPSRAGSDNAGKQYEVSLRVGKKVYVVLYVAETNQPEPNLYVGTARTVLIDGNTLKFNDVLGHTHSTRILSSKDAPASK